jgi:uncharacterized protein YecE (DUF72 family)
MSVIIGTSGWHYRDWKQRFYPEAIPQREWLAFHADHFTTVESNNAFYRLPEGERFAVWARSTPADFIMAVKMSRYLTHLKRLRDPAEPVSRVLERAQHLGGKLSPVLLM